MPAHPLEPLTRLPDVAESVAQARAACTELRWHRALRRQWAVARVESGVRAVHAGAVLLGALRVQAEVERL